jgi:hypothetical protein
MGKISVAFSGLIIEFYARDVENHMADQFDLDFWYLDFKHQKTQEGLWLDSRGNLPLVAAEVAATAPGTVQLNIFAWNKELTKYVICQDSFLLIAFIRRAASPCQVANDFVQVINACAGLGALKDSRQSHPEIIESGFESYVFVGCSLIDMYSKCGGIDNAWRVVNHTMWSLGMP